MKSLRLDTRVPLNVALLDELLDLNLLPIKVGETDPKNYLSVDYMPFGQLFTHPIFTSFKIQLNGVIFDPSGDGAIHAWFYRGEDYYSISGEITTSSIRLILADPRFQNLDISDPKDSSAGLWPINFKIYDYELLDHLIPLLKYDFHY